MYSRKKKNENPLMTLLPQGCELRLKLEILNCLAIHYKDLHLKRIKLEGRKNKMTLKSQCILDCCAINNDHVNKQTNRIESGRLICSLFAKRR